MAASNPVLVSEDILKNELECPVCMDEKRLLLLPCAHRCCPDCIKRIAGEDGHLECPTCRAPAHVPDQGFPVCVLTGHIQDILIEARENRDASVVPDLSTPTARKGETTKCDVCAEENVNVRCNNCRQFLCFRCAVSNKMCVTASTQHITTLIEQTFGDRSQQLKQWQETVQTEVSFIEAELTPLKNEKTALQKERRELETRLNAVNQRITAVEKGIDEKQKSLDDKSSVLKAAEMIESDGDVVEIIRLTEQICDPMHGPLPISKPPTAKTEPLKPQSPAALQFISEHRTRTPCLAADHHSITGDILLRCAGGVKIFSRDSREVKNLTNHVRAQVVEYKGEIFISHHDLTVIKVNKYNMDTKSTELLYSFPMKSRLASYLSVSDRFIASLDPDNNTIKLYNRETENNNNSGGASRSLLSELFLREPQQTLLKTLTLPEYKVLISLCFLPDGDLLVTGHDTKKHMLNKYRLGEDPEKDIRLIWSCDQVSQAAGVAVADSGLIFVNGVMNKTIYVVSPEGEKMKQYLLDRLPSHYEYISVRGDELAVAGWGEKKLLLFKIVW